MNHYLSDELNLEPGLGSALDRLKMGDFQTRWEAAKAIPDFGTAAIEPLLTILEEEETDWELLWFVARILGNLDDPSGIAALINLLKSVEHTEVASMAATALSNYGIAAIAPLAELLQDESTRLLAVQALVQIRQSDVIAPLLSVVNDSDPAVRSAAIEALSHFYDPAISAALLAALEDLNPIVRKAAVVGLGIQADAPTNSWNQPELTECLKQRLWDFHPEVCRQAAIALARVGTDAAADALFAVLQSPHTPLLLQTEAIRALAWMNTVYALEQLKQLLQSDLAGNFLQSTPSPVLSPQQEIITVLGRMEFPESKAKAVEILLELLNSNPPLLQDPQTRQTIALSLGQLGQLEALDALISFLADTNASVRFHAIAALKQLHSDKAYERLQELAQNQNIEPKLQAGVTIALQEWRN